MFIHSKRWAHELMPMSLTVVDHSQRDLFNIERLLKKGKAKIKATASKMDQDFLRQAQKADGLLMGISSGDSMESVRKRLKLATNYFKDKVIVISEKDDPEFVLEVLSYGITGFLPKKEMKEKLISACNCVLKFGSYLDSKYNYYLLRRIQSIETSTKIINGIRVDLEKLQSIFSDRECAIFLGMLEGKSSQNILKNLYVAEATFKRYISNMLKKANVKSRVELIAFGFKNGICSLHNEASAE
ncbi:DNA-binding NarL/FixJ family response regulator [Pullulanibacillus pueri]|uniref:HTH luxR-type domain-containing protein n=1 Tax=Pullulanibacillus pueri TaxID=1437324 RepID=A0A8J2ZSZ1_9BACL|nr:LuxR C-terminal-related transcriptional regulator [Pullulanibacillus pueri]MBM7684118.1 DNA-binding NarL/FixJ family response regulator [Pullulanibacillus pueri]GGH76680.1 hypothetical protein GCM10007096_07470 [Pullulanibacillus pueri]